MLAFEFIPAYLLLFFGICLLTLVMTPLVIRLAHKVGAVDRGGFRRINLRQTPRMGGLAILLPLLALCLPGVLASFPFFACFVDDPAPVLSPLLAGGAMIALLGMFDDLRELRPRDKFLIQIAVAGLVYLGGHALRYVELPWLGVIDLGRAGGLALTVLWIVGVINAFNLVDGIDGLAAGLALIGAAGLGVVAVLGGQAIVALLCLALVGSLAAFLVFNFYPARIFLGDTGSLFLGFIMATLGIMASSGPQGEVPLLVPVLALAIPIFDTMVAFARRILRGRDPFVGDCSHTHHRLLESGCSQRRAALILYAVAVLGAVAAIFCQVLNPARPASLLPLLLFLPVLGVLAWHCGFLRLHHLIHVVHCRSRNSLLKSFTRFATLAVNADPSPASLEHVMRTGCRVMRLGLLEVGISGGSADDPPSTHVLALGSRSAAAADADGNEWEPIQEIQIGNRAGQALTVRFQFARPPVRLEPAERDRLDADVLERQDVEACLARLFSRLQLAIPAARPTHPSLHLSEFRENGST